MKIRQETELNLLRKIEALEQEIKEIKGENKEPIPIYQYSRIRDIDLDEIVNISQKINRTKFNNWFINDIDISNKDELFLLELLEQEENYISLYNEETLKMRFLSPLLRRIDFKTEQFQEPSKWWISFHSIHPTFVAWDLCITMRRRRWERENDI
ncbi:hypothetical protein QUF74_03905 [Candidatus Halobeggiatoa sp. HSG11]|nr:hypothetical protein [Candidatus Halobeggiatoa sp. HSG11]